MGDTSSTTTTGPTLRIRLGILQTEVTSNFVRLKFTDAPHQDFTEMTVPYRVLKTVRKVTVTLIMELAWVVFRDTKVQSVIKNAADTRMDLNVHGFVETAEIGKNVTI